MAYDEGLAYRVREFLNIREGFNEKKMFGGLCYLIDGNMACGVLGDELIVRVGPDAYEEALNEANTRIFDFTGRPMKGWVVVTAEGHSEDEDLERWVGRGVKFALSLPPK